MGKAIGLPGGGWGMSKATAAGQPILEKSGKVGQTGLLKAFAAI